MLTLLLPVPPTFPPPPPPIPLWTHSDKHDFTECDMGGGRRTPLIKQGPQYYLRTLPSKRTLLHMLYRPRGRSLLVERTDRLVWRR